MPLKIWMMSLLILFIGTSSLTAQKYSKANEREGLAIGSLVKDFSAKDQKNQTFQLSEALKKGPVVLIFYRGQWCPICNRHLSQLQDSLNLIQQAGATVIAVSPEKTEYLQKTAHKTGADFQLLHDLDYKIADYFQVSFQPKKSIRRLYNTALGARLKKAHSDKSERLPIPASFIIDQDAKIVWRHFDPNYKKRSTVAAILENLPKAKK